MARDELSDLARDIGRRSIMLAPQNQLVGVGPSLVELEGFRTSTYDLWTRLPVV